MFKPSTIEDARGQRIEFMVGIDLSYIKAVLGKNEYRSIKPVYEEDVLGITSWYSLFGSSLILNLLGYLILTACSFAVFGIMMWTGTSIRWFILFGVCLIGVGVTIMGIARVLRQFRSINRERPFVRMVLNFGRCPACLYSLAGHAAESDGCTVCPECGGAWKLP